jgi:hypothetical protein
VKSHHTTSHILFLPSLSSASFPLSDPKKQAYIRFDEDQLNDILTIIQQVFEEEESSIPKGVEFQEMEKIGNKLLGAAKKKGGRRRKV